MIRRTRRDVPVAVKRRNWVQGPGSAVLGGGLAAALLTGVALFAANTATDTMRGDAQVRVRSNRDAAVRALTRQTDDFKRTVKAHAAEPEIVDAFSDPTQNGQDRARATLGLLARSKGSAAAFISDLSGRNVAIFPDQPELIGKDFSFRDWFQGVSRTGSAYVSEGYRSAAAGQPLVVAISTPVHDGQARVGYLTVLWKLDSVRNVVDGSQQDDGITLTVTDQAGQSLAGPLTVDDRGQPVEQPLSPVTREALAGQAVSTIVNEMLTVAGPVPGLGWTVTATLPESVALAPASSFRRSLLLSLAVSLVLVAAFALAAAQMASRRRQTQVARDLDRQRLEALFGQAPVGILECRLDGSIIAANSALAQMLGYEPDELLGTSGTALLAPDELPAGQSAEQLLPGAPPATRNRQYKAKDGSWVPAAVSMFALTAPGSGDHSLVAFIVDQREQQRTETALRTSESRFRRIFDEGLIGKILVAPNGTITRVNASFARQIGVEAEQLIGRSLLSLFTDPDDHDELSGSALPSADATFRREMSMRRANGQTMHALVALCWITDAANERLLLVQVEDITARQAAEERLTELALHDALTGLPNRRLLLERCEQAFSRATSGRGPYGRVALLFLDLDGFKPVNDHHGHSAGDALLIGIATDLTEALRPTDTIARVGGDEFVILIEQDEIEQLRVLADRLTAIVQRQISTGTSTQVVTASIGIAHADLRVEPALTPEQLLQRADTAMYRAKERGRNRHDTYDDELHTSTQARVELQRSVRAAVEDNRLHLVFQSVIDIDTGAVIGAEALLRLHDTGGRLLPTLPAVVAAENAGFIDIIGDRVLDLALHAASSWPPHMSVAVNISARELTGAHLRRRVEGAITRHGTDPRRLVLEITESSLLTAGPSALSALSELRSLGIKIAIDDFGTAYATLQNLTTLPVDVLKVDATFTAGLPEKRTHTAIVHGIASMARELAIPCIVEGVETSAQLDVLEGLGLQGQGWFWGQPQPAPTIPRILSELPLPRGGLPVPADLRPARRQDPTTSQTTQSQTPTGS